MEDKALSHIFNDIYRKVLQLSENPSEFAEYLTHQIRELIGTRTVVFAIKTETGQPEIFNVYPERRKQWANQSTVIKLAELSFNFDKLEFLEQTKCNKEYSQLLQKLEIEKTIAIPLIAGNRKIGSILLLDIMDAFGIDSVLHLLERLSGVFALVIRNAYLYHDMENQVLQRTEEISQQNEELQQNEEELQSINEELTEALEKADELNRKLKESDERFNLAMQASNDGLFDWNLETNEIYYSPGWKKMLGYEDHELPNDFSIWEKLTKPEDAQKSWELQQKMITKQTDRFVMEFKMKHKEGHWVDILSRAEAIFNNNGTAIRIVGTHTDISDRKKGESILRENEEKYRLLHENAGLGIGYYKPDGTIMSYNRIASKDMGGEPEDFAGKSIFEIFPKADAEYYYKRIEKACVTEEPIVYEDKVALPTGDKHFLSTYSKITDSNNQILGIQVISQNITEQKNIEAEIKNARIKAEATTNKLETALASMTESVFISDIEGNLVDFNEAFVKFHRFKNKDECAKTLKEYPAFLDVFFPDGDLTRPDQWAIPRALKGETATNQEFTLRRKDTGESWIGSYSFAPIRNTDDEIVGCVVTCVDITESKKARIELIKAKEKAEESDRLKSAFLANMSHEIRTPMNGILGFTSLLQEPDLTGKQQQQYIEIIQKSGDRMLNTVNDIIDISKIEAGQTTITVSETNIAEKLETLHSFFKPEAEKKGIQFSLKNLLSEQECIVETDKDKLNSILTNLIKNAIKFCNEGGIEFGVELKSNNKKHELKFFVKDSGIGIAHDRQQAIFERFIQADIEDKNAVQGSGLGLAISKAYTEMLGGKIWVESEYGKGSIFYFTIPYSNIHKNEIDIESTEVDDVPLSLNLKILIVEDDETSGQFLTIIANKYGKEIITAINGTEAVKACQLNPDIDLVLMDIQLPKMNGYEATRKIREFNKDVIIISQTAFAQTGDKEKAMEAGCNDYISKPINTDKFDALMRKHFSSKWKKGTKKTERNNF